MYRMLIPKLEKKIKEFTNKIGKWLDKLWYVLSIERKKVGIKRDCGLSLQLCKNMPQRECLKKKIQKCQ